MINILDKYQLDFLFGRLALFQFEYNAYDQELFTNLTGHKEFEVMFSEQ